MTPARILGALIEGALGGRRKRSRGALGYLTGGRGSLVNASTLLAAAGLAWGAYEAATRQSGTAPAPASPGPVPGGPIPQPAMTGHLPPPPPLSPVAGLRVTDSGPSLPADVVRAIRLAISAARVDGTLGPAEREAIVARAREVGAEEIVDQELESPRPLAEIVAGVTDSELRAELYRIAFAIVRADEAVTGAERIYLAQLAHHLGLDPAATSRLEAEVVTAIDAAEMA